MTVLVTNTITGNETRRTTHKGSTYLVADVTAAKAMRLNGGYVPGEEWRKSAPQWSGVPLPVGHPTNSKGQYISARIPDVVENAVVGRFYNTTYNPQDESLEGELWVDVERARKLGGYHERVVEMLENGEPLEVSTAYRAEDGDPGHYNGEYREQVKVDLKPDHLALLPENLGPGKCSVEDGCGTGRNPVSNTHGGAAQTRAAVSQAETDGVSNPPFAGYTVNGEAGDTAERVYLNMKPRNALQTARTPDYSGEMPSDEAESDWDRPDLSEYVDAYFEHSDAEVPDELPETTGDLSDDAAQWIASKSLLGNPEADTYTELVMFPVVRPSDDWLSESALESVLVTVDTADISSDQEQSVESKAQELLEEEFDWTFDDESTNSETTDEVAEMSSPDDPNAGDESETSGESESPDANTATTASDSLFRRLVKTVVTLDSTSDATVQEFDSEALSGVDDSESETGSAGSPASESGSDSTSPDDGAQDAETEANTTTGESSGEATNADTAADPDADGQSQSAPDTETDTESTDATQNLETDAKCGCHDEETAVNETDDDTTTDTMSDYDLEAIANETGFSVEELQEMDEGKVESLSSLVNATAEDADAADAEAEAEAEAEADEANADADDEGAEAEAEANDEDADADADATPTFTEDEINEMVENTVSEVLQDELEDTVQGVIEGMGLDEIAANHQQEKQQQRESWKNTILSNSDKFSEDTLDQMPDEALQSTAEELRPRTGTDFSARAPASASTSSPTTNDESEEDAGPATAGTFADYVESQE